MQTLSQHKAEISEVVSGTAVFGDRGIEVLYGCDPSKRAELLKAELATLEACGYRAKIVGRNKLIAIDLTNVGTAIHARYVK